MKKLFSLRMFIICMCAFILCILATVAPLNRLAGSTLLASLPTSLLLTIVGTKLPTDLHLTADVHASQVNTDTLEFLSIVVLIYLFYACSAYIAQKHIHVQKVSTHTKELVQSHSTNTILRLIWLGAILVGIICVLTPAMLSHDAFVYAGYGRVIVTHHANPYYTPLSAFPHDPLFALDDWRDALAAYGPLWLLICAISTFVAGSSILHYIFFYRILGFVAHLLNIALVTAILRKLRCSPHIIVIGTILYAWNPLVLLESCMGGHNDTVMMTCILLGVLLCVRAEQDAFIHARDYLPPIIAFTCAALIKFTAAPMIAFYLVLLARHVLTNRLLSQQQGYIHYRFRWLIELRTVSSTALISMFLAVTLYTPLWVGHTIREMVHSLGSPPSSRLAFGSTLLALQKVAARQVDSPLALFSLHSTWNLINVVVIVSLFGIGALWLWSTPTTLTMIHATLATLGALLIVTPWFFPWYVIWLVVLAVIGLPMYHKRVGRALVSSALLFSASAFLIYLFRGYAPIGDWIGFTSLTTIGPPLIVFLFALLLAPKVPSHGQQKRSETAETVNQAVP
ncbi:MAG: hypothetical protein NVS4B11_19630 [Ktedonobacteraceae bacterium]